MAITVSEFIESRRVSDVGGQKRGFTIWHAYDTAGASIGPSDIEALYGTTLPDVGDSFPSDTTMRRADVPRLERVPGHASLMRVEFEYSPTGAIVIGDDEPRPGEVGYLSWTSQSSAEFDDFYRNPYAGASIPPTDGHETGVAGTQGNKTDIGGTQINERGVPERRLRFKQAVTITEVIEFQPSEGPPIPDWDTFIGKRNSVAFLGSVIGKVLYIGHTFHATGFGRGEVSHDFIHDNLYHMVQVPKRNDNGDVLHAAGADATAVWWRQPHPLTADLGLLSDRF